MYAPGALNYYYLRLSFTGKELGLSAFPIGLQ